MDFRTATQGFLWDDLAKAESMSALKKEALELAGSRHSAATLSAYAYDWADFEAWCLENGRQPLPADPDETVGPYLVSQLKLHKITTVERRLAAIGWQHAQAGLVKPITLTVRAVLTGARRRRTDRSDRKAALSVDDLRLVVGALDARPGPRATRDKAAILLAFAGAFRRSEVAGLDLADVSVGKDRLTVFLRRSKTDQVGQGSGGLAIPQAHDPALCVVRALREWVAVRGKSPGALFFELGLGGVVKPERMKGNAIWYALRKAAGEAGLDPTLYGAHSLRAGAITASADAGADVFQIMALSGHRSMETVQKYVRRSTRDYPLAAVL